MEHSWILKKSVGQDVKSAGQYCLKGHYANQCPKKEDGVQLMMTTTEPCQKVGELPHNGDDLHFSFLFKLIEA